MPVIPESNRILLERRWRPSDSCRVCAAMDLKAARAYAEAAAAFPDTLRTQPHIFMQLSFRDESAVTN